MKKIVNSALLVLMAAGIFLVGCALKAGVGKIAPDFSLVDVSDRVVKLGDFKGKNVVLVFYVSHGCKPCRQQLVELQERISEIKEFNAEVIAIASRGQKNVEKTKKLGITFTLIPDPEFSTAKKYGVYDYDRNRAIATVIVDKNGVIRFRNVAWDVHDRPSVSKIIKVLREIG